MTPRPTGVQSLPKDSWIGLEQVLSWICFDEAFDIATLRDNLPVMGISEEQAKEEYQVAWRELADFASIKRWTVRGNQRARETKSQSQELSRNDLFNCRFIDFVLTPRGEAVLVSRFDRDEQGIWQTISDRDGSDFARVLIRRDDLLDFKARASRRIVRRKASRASGLEALEYLREFIAPRSASEVRRDPLMEDVCRRFGVTQKTAWSCWKQATKDRLDLRSPGRRKRIDK